MMQLKKIREKITLIVYLYSIIYYLDFVAVKIVIKKKTLDKERKKKTKTKLNESIHCVMTIGLFFFFQSKKCNIATFSAKSAD